jgi:hypothetical protein
MTNGSVDANAMLFWDGLEANLNPRLIQHLAPCDWTWRRRESRSL